MKRAHVLIILLSFAVWFSLTACSSKSSQYIAESISQSGINTTDAKEIAESSARLKRFRSFLRDEISSESKTEGARYLRDFCNCVVPGETEDEIRYALFDMTGDGQPELHVLTDISYSIHTIESDQLITWYQGDRHNRPLNNRAILQKVESTGTHYAYVVLDSNGKEVFCVGFSSPPGPKYKYLFDTGGDEIELSKSDWDRLTEPMLSIGSDKIDWKDIKDLDKE